MTKRWIRSNESVPQAYIEPVLVHLVDDDDMLILRSARADITGKPYWYDDRGNIYTMEGTHWMPLPKPPERKKDAQKGVDLRA